eukprot:TRINITY_DN2671_c0_g1_i1.p1 TRINITY_DN2671_c0_g1~~TRINITY_DN2671_c0_g1_i1.p1  ORF type:complete len:434 (+),score=163.19 TRINITY_DN2671_c0_g1_i1:89-1390(+)
MSLQTTLKQFDFIIFGATGFTGQFVLKHFIEVLKEQKLNYKFAIAGRNFEKLKRLIDEQNYQEKIDIIIADVENQQQLVEMCEKTKLILNCVGPYRFYGKQIVKAAIKSKCDYLDICGEPEFMEKMQYKYNNLACENDCLIVSACAFDCLPAELGTIFVDNIYKQINGVCVEIESILNLTSGKQGFCGHYTTYECAVHGFASQKKLMQLRRKIQQSKKPVENLKIKTVKRNLPFYNKTMNRWCVPFLGADRSVVSRSQYELAKQSSNSNDNNIHYPIQYNAFFGIISIFYLFIFFIFAITFAVLARFKFGQKLLLKYPKVFTNGYFSHDGPTTKQLEETRFEMLLFAKGFANKNNISIKPNYQVTVKICGPEPGYVATPILFVQAALTLLEEKENFTIKSGVLPPGAVFAKSKLIERLQSKDIKFELIYQGSQ